MFILGISSWFHDSAACIIKDGEIIAAAQEERFTRIKHDSSFPLNAIKYCLSESNITLNDLENIVFFEKPFLKFERLLETYLAFAPRGFKSFSTAMPLWVKDKLFQKSNIVNELSKMSDVDSEIRDKLLFSEHHLSHAASAFYPSPFDRAAVLTLDAVGEWATSSLCIGKKNKLEVHKEIHFPHSLGLLYSAFTYYTGFKVNSGEYKVMGLAPYGEPRYVDKIKKHLIKIHDDGSFHLNMSYFNYATGLTMTNKKFHKLFDGPPRIPEADLTQKQMDLAASIQKVIEEVVVKLGRNIADTYGEKNLCLAGGVALNCVANGVLLRENIFDNIWIQPAAGDAGGALGAALASYYIHHKRKRIINKKDSMQGSYLGPSFDDDMIQKSLDDIGAKYNKLSTNDLINETASLLANENAVGWMQGRMEFGPRALGGRSILGDPRSPKMQKQLNLKVKYRESFRPFAPSILYEKVNDWFEHDSSSPYMLLVADIKKNKRLDMTSDQHKLFGIEKLNVPRSTIPAITHVDYSARLQTVHRDTNQIYYSLIEKFNELTGCPVLVNTSFNVRGEPIVCSPNDAFKCFMSTEMDILVIGNFIMYKKDQDESLKKSYVNNYELD